MSHTAEGKTQQWSTADIRRLQNNARLYFEYRRAVADVLDQVTKEEKLPVALAWALKALHDVHEEAEGRIMKRTLIYLSIPYSGMETKSFHLSCLIAGQLMEEGNAVWSPISHSHPISQAAGIPQNDHDFWLSKDLEMLSRCDLVLVVTYEPAWRHSRGVKAEIAEAERLGKPIVYVAPAWFVSQDVLRDSLAGVEAEPCETK
jgi:anaerobic selenocysteine-containing dehydrogenase